MIVLRVLSYNGAPAEGPQAQFDELGGTIGRADNNQLVLPDPERTISRVHARVVFRNGGYAVVDNGSNPISVNGLAVGSGREQALKPGDQLQIGGYVIGFSAAAAAREDPFADLFGEAAGLAHPNPTAAPPPRPAPTAMWPAPAAPGAPVSPVAPVARSSAPSAVLAPGHIPDDWDPFAPDHAAPAPAATLGGHDPFADLPAGGGQSLDDLFGLSGTTAADDPLAAAQPRTATLMPPTPSDHVSDLNMPMPRPALQAPAPSPAPSPSPAPLPAGAVFSWQDPPRDGRIVTLPGVRRADSSPAAADTGAAPTAAAATPPSATEVELLGALLQGLGTPGLRVSALNADTLQLLGQLLRESIRGAVELLVARAALKREMRADVTMIVSRENNPLKFSPTVEVALQHLLGPPAPGFMPAAAAVRDAFDDLRAHQLGVMAGMRAALEGVLGRFDPQQLEAKLTHRSAINSLIPATRKARLWESFQELFAQLQTEAQDDFDELFGKAFLRAYEDQLDRLQREPQPR